MSPSRPPEIWDRIDRVSKIACCHAESGADCKGYHQQGTRVIYGYEVLCRSVMGAIHGARNAGLDDAITEISELVTLDGRVQKSDVLEIMSRIKWPNA